MKSVIQFLNIINNVDSKILREIKLLLNCALVGPTHAALDKTGVESWLLFAQ